MIKIRLILAFLIIAALEISASNPEKLNKTFLYRHFDSEQGLSGNQISHIIQASNGYLWISHWKGFSRFDGKNFKNYRDTDGLLASSSFEAVEYKPEHFIIQHIKGLSFFSPQEPVTKVMFPDTIRGLRIGKSLHHNNQFWIFNCYSTISKKISHLRYDNGWHQVNLLFSDTVLAIIPRKNNQSVFILTENSIYQLENENLSQIGRLRHNYRSYSIDPNGSCRGFSGDDSQFYLIEAWNSVISEIPTHIFAPNFFTQKLPDSFVVLPDHEGIVYFNNHYELFLANNQGIKSLGRSFSLIRKLMIDKEKNLWVATEEGLFNFFRLDFERIKLTFTDKSDMFWSISNFGNGRIIAGRFGFGFVELMDSVWIPVKMDYSKDLASGMEPNAPLMGALSSKKGEAWMPVWKGLVKFNSSGKPIRIPLSTTPQDLYIDPISPDTIFAATSGGMLVIDKHEKMSFMGKSVGFSGIQNESILRDRKNRFWLGSSQGPIQIFDGKKVLPENQTPALSNVISSQKDSEGNLWFGTDKGLLFYDYQDFVKIKPELLNESIDLVVNYNDSLLVCVGFKKLVLINYRKKPFDIQIYDEHELGVIQNTSMIDKQGYLWFSSMYDLIRFNPVKLFNQYSDAISTPFVSSVEYSTDNVHWSIFKPGFHPDSENNNLRFNYLAIVFKNQEQVRYRYYLENFDSWSEPTGNREVYYTNLNPGNYRLGVQCSIEGQAWSPVTYSDEIEIKPAWHQLIWVRAILLILMVLVIFWIIFAAQREFNRRKIRHLTEQKKLNQLQLQLVRSKQIPHFSGNALANIEHFIFKADVRQANKYLSMFSRLMNRTLRDADKISQTLEQELEYVRLYLELEIMRFDNAFGYRFNIDENVDSSQLIPNMMLHTLVENAIKHGLRHKKGKGMILISASASNDAILLSIEDNGIGRKNAVLMGTSGTGTGLKILREQLEIHNKVNIRKINMVITDLEGLEGEVLGTLISIYIPKNYEFSY